jgi:ubiquinone/menaquinone biosynthesis C-methylase UbiE
LESGPSFPAPPAPATMSAPAPATYTAPPPATSASNVPFAGELHRRPEPRVTTTIDIDAKTIRITKSSRQVAPRLRAAPRNAPAAVVVEPTLFEAQAATAPESLDPKTANIIYHDWEARSYDEKWSISFDERITAYAREKFLKVMPEARYGRVLEIGAGTGFFIINLWLAGLVDKASATDISPGMVEVCKRNAAAAGLPDLEARPADAEALPFPDNSFDLVVGHAVLHHLPDVPKALSEALRVLKPGGSLVITGEPTRIGHAVVHIAQRATATAVKAAGRLVPRILKGPDTSEKDPAAALEKHVDLHEFSPGHVRSFLKKAGYESINVQTEELVSGLFGWSARTLEAMTAPGILGDRWPWFAYHTYIRLYRFDHLVMRRLVPKPLFYNLLFSARKPSG